MNDTTRPHGIPTLYRGTMFRSRTEARWAAFFDNCNWRWDYEPFDLAGYIPDFALRFHESLLVEIKAEQSIEKLNAFRSKIENCGCHGEALITLASPQLENGAAPIIGIIGERIDLPRELDWQWSPARLFVCIGCGSMSVLAEDGDWRCRVCGEGEGNEHVGHVPLLEGKLKEWSLAENRTQWRAAL